ncbi:MAG: ABC transporter ATP-binding protein [Anaerolineaceae bacterium]|nr:ABC transporter ATP-binding protein [Anaerolineaceae bacterium]
MLQVHQISKNFGGLRALREVTFSVTEGEIVGLIGPNGSGKSTAFNVITGFLPATSGTVTFKGETVSDLPAHEVARRGIARTFQLVRPFPHLTTLDNVLAGALFGASAFPSKKAAEPHAYQVLELVGLAPKAQVLARHLTIMERKWLEVARALAGQPQLLLLDEFMAGLNPSEIPEALALIRQLNATGITIIVVEHIIKVITHVCQRVIVLNAGQKLAEGTAIEVIENPLVIEAYLGSHYAKH